MAHSIPFPVNEIRVRKVRTNDSQLDLNDPATYRPRANGIHVDLILQQATITGWLTKHRAPTFSFMKNIKRRYVVLVDRFLYAFKSETPETYREFLELTVNSHAFVTDQFSGALFCIEIKKMGYDDSWFLQADDAETMKLWLDRIKRTISWLREGHSGTITKTSLAKVITEEEEYSLAAANARQAIYDSPSSSKSNISIDTCTSSSSIIFPLPPPSQQNSIHHQSQPSSPISSHYENGSISSFQSSVGGFSSSEYSAMDSPRRKSSLRVSRPSLSSSNYSNNTIPTVLPPQLPPPKSLPPPVPSYAYL
jgi:hypothetical protein